jgi:hypothetical protein
MTAHGAEHAWLQVSEGHIIGKAAGVDLGVVVAVWIAAMDEHPVSAVDG